MAWHTVQQPAVALGSHCWMSGNSACCRTLGRAGALPFETHGRLLRGTAVHTVGDIDVVVLLAAKVAQEVPLLAGPPCLLCIPA